MGNIFIKHPRTMNETYLEHMQCACKFGMSMIIGGVACVIHAFFPFAFITTGSDFLYKMMRNYILRLAYVDERTEELAKLILQKQKRNQVVSEKMYG